MAGMNFQTRSSTTQEFGSFDLADIQQLRTIIGKQFYAVPYIDEKDGSEHYNMVIE